MRSERPAAVSSPLGVPFSSASLEWEVSDASDNHHRHCSQPYYRAACRLIGQRVVREEMLKGAESRGKHSVEAVVVVS